MTVDGKRVNVYSPPNGHLVVLKRIGLYSVATDREVLKWMHENFGHYTDNLTKESYYRWYPINDHAFGIRDDSDYSYFLLKWGDLL